MLGQYIILQGNMHFIICRYPSTTTLDRQDGLTLAFIMKQNDHDLSSEQISMLKNPPHRGPFHEIYVSQRKLIEDGYLERVPSKEVYQLTEKGRDAILKYDKSKT